MSSLELFPQIDLLSIDLAVKWAGASFFSEVRYSYTMAHKCWIFPC